MLKSTNYELNDELSVDDPVLGAVVLKCEMHGLFKFNF